MHDRVVAPAAPCDAEPDRLARATAARLLVAALVPAAVLLAGSLLEQLGAPFPAESLRQQVSVHGEGTVLAWYQSALLAGAGAMAALCAALPCAPGAPANGSAGWAVVAVLLAVAAADEMLELHETSAAALAGRGAPDRLGPIDREWYVYVPIAAVLVAAGRTWIRGLWRARADTGWALAGAAVWAFALVVDTTHVRGALLKDVLEETLETLGSGLLLAGLARVAVGRATAARSGLRPGAGGAAV